MLEPQVFIAVHIPGKSLPLFIAAHVYYPRGSAFLVLKISTE